MADDRDPARREGTPREQRPGTRPSAGLAGSGGFDRGSGPRQGSIRAVTSLQNDHVKLVRSLEMRKARRETGLFVAEGASLLITARDNGWIPTLVVAGPGARDVAAVRDLLDWAVGAGADCLDISAPVLEKLAAKDNPQAVMAVFRQSWAAVPSPSAVAREALWIALEGVRDPGNLGTILRTADAVGAAGVLLVGQSCDPFSREAVRASMGSIFAIPVTRMEAAAFAGLAAAWPGDVVGTHLAATEDFRSAAAWREPHLVVMGSEGAGLTDAASKLCTRLVRIPMAGRLDSLNLAVATALVLYEARRSRLVM
jgi:TrmH family RNA methyltransferase